VHPLIVVGYEDGSIQEYFDKVRKNRSNRKYFSRTEVVFSELIGSFQPNFQTD
jgi:DNA topoisomerase-1